MTAPKEVTQLLIDWSNGDKSALDKLLPIVYRELRHLAGSHLRNERSDHTLQPTALVHEAYLRLIDCSNIHWKNRAHFFGIAAQLMRNILIDHARSHRADKRGGSRDKLSLDEVPNLSEGRDVDFIALNDTLTNLAAIDPQQSRIVELRYFGGLTIEETAEVLGISPATVKREWSLARAWLFREMSNLD